MAFFIFFIFHTVYSQKYIWNNDSSIEYIMNTDTSIGETHFQVATKYLQLKFIPFFTLFKVKSEGYDYGLSDLNISYNKLWCKGNLADNKNLRTKRWGGGVWIGAIIKFPNNSLGYGYGIDAIYILNKVSFVLTIGRDNIYKSEGVFEFAGLGIGFDLGGAIQKIQKGSKRTRIYTIN